MTEEISLMQALGSPNPPRPYATRSRIHTGPLVITLHLVFERPLSPQGLPLRLSYNTDIFYLPPLLDLPLPVIINIYDDPHPDGTLKNAVRKNILHYRQLYADKPDPIIFLPVTVKN
jgi:hypothetical protein